MGSRLADLDLDIIALRKPLHFIRRIAFTNEPLVEKASQVLSAHGFQVGLKIIGRSEAVGQGGILQIILNS